MKRTNLIFILFALAFVTIFTTVFYHSNKELLRDYFDPTVVQTIMTPMDVKVADHFGINLDTDAIHFGKVPALDEGLRGFTINNSFTIPTQAELWFSGDMAPWMSASENNIILAPAESRLVNLTVTIPEGVNAGLYTGALHVVFRRLP